MDEERAYCNIHEGHCVMIEDLRTDGVVLRNDMKDMRKSCQIDLEKADAAACKKFVTKTEFNLIKPGDYVTQREIADIKKVFYGFVLATISYMAKGLFL